MTAVFKREGVKNRGKSTDVLVPISDLFRLMPNFRSSQNRRKVEKAVGTLESGINIWVRLLIFEVYSRGYLLIKGGYVY